MEADQGSEQSPSAGVQGAAAPGSQKAEQREAEAPPEGVPEAKKPRMESEAALDDDSFKVEVKQEGGEITVKVGSDKAHAKDEPGSSPSPVVVKDEPTEGTLGDSFKVEVKEEGGEIKVKVEPDSPVKVKEEPGVKTEPGIRPTPVKLEVIETIEAKAEPADAREVTVIEPQHPWGEGSGEGDFEKRPVIANCFVRVSSTPWDTEAWGLIVQELRGRPLEETEDVFRRFLYYYPSAGHVLSEYIRAILACSRLSAEERRDRVEQLFHKGLRYAHIDLWQAYTEYILKKGDTVQTQKAYAVALSRVGQDYESERMWRDCIAFLSRRGGEFKVQQEIRESYHGLLKAPVRDLELHFKNYERWERSIGPLRIQDTLRTAHERAKYHYSEIRNITSLIDSNFLSRPPEYYRLEGVTSLGSVWGRHIPKDLEQAVLWMRLIDFEKENHMSLEPRPLKDRIVTTCRKALTCMCRNPIFWYILARYHYDTGNYTAANITFCEALVVCPQSLLLRFAYCDMLRSIQPNRLLKTPMRTNSALPQIIWQSEDQCVEAIRQSGKTAGDSEHFGPFALGCALLEDTLARTDSLDPSFRTLVWVHFIRFLKATARSDGELQLYRSYLKRADTDPATSSGQLYLAAARLEKQEIAVSDGGVDKRGLLEKGLTRQREGKSLSTAFLLNYIQGLSALGDDNSLRTLFTHLFEVDRDWMDFNETKSVLEVFNKYVEFMLWKGELRDVHAAEAKREQRFGKEQVGTMAIQLVHRYSFCGLIPVTAAELDAINEMEDLYVQYLQGKLEGVQTTSNVVKQEQSMQDLTLPAHTNPLRPKLSNLAVLDLKKFVTFPLPLNRHRWGEHDDQNTDAPKGPVAVAARGVWNPKLAPSPSTDSAAAAKSQTPTSTVQIPSHVGRLLKALPARETFEGVKPKTKYIIKYFRENQIPSLVQGGVSPEKLADAQRKLERLGFKTESIVAEKDRVREMIENLRREPEHKKRADAAQLALAIILTHAQIAKPAAV